MLQKNISPICAEERISACLNGLILRMLHMVWVDSLVVSLSPFLRVQHTEIVSTENATNPYKSTPLVVGTPL
jgi:hydrogenase maturation factor HypE